MHCNSTDLPDLPALDNPAKVKGWSRWVEIENRSECGGWCRRFVLLDDSSPERQLLAITAVEVDSLNQYAAPYPYLAGDEPYLLLATHHSVGVPWISS